ESRRVGTAHSSPSAASAGATSAGPADSGGRLVGVVTPASGGQEDREWQNERKSRVSSNRGNWSQHEVGSYRLWRVRDRPGGGAVRFSTPESLQAPLTRRVLCRGP